MKINQGVLLSGIFAFCLIFPPVFTQAAETKAVPACKTNEEAFTPEQVRIVGVDPQSEAAKEILATYRDLVDASNKHSIEDIIKHYNPQFISGDNLTLDQIKSLIQDTWKAYPDICYNSRPIEVRVNGDWATVETLDKSYATAPPDKDVITVPGKLVSESRSLLFMRRMGSSWEVTSDSTVWEQAIIRYGIGDEVQITLSAPEQVKAGESYSARIQANIPESAFSIATIDNQPLTYPHQKVDDKFRSLSPDSRELNRVLTANAQNHNEVVTATLGLTSVEQKDPERPSLSLNGIATIVKRVNVVPISAEDVLAAMKKKDLVKTSASGLIDLNNPVSAVTNSSPPELQVSPANPNPSPDNPEQPDEGQPSPSVSPQ